MPENLSMALISDNHDQTSDNNNNSNNNNNSRFKRPMYKGVRPYTTMGGFNNNSNKTQQTTSSTNEHRTKSASPPRQQSMISAGRTSKRDYDHSPSPFWSKTEYQHTYNERHPESEVPDLRDSRDARKPLLERRHHVLMGERKIYLQR